MVSGMAGTNPAMTIFCEWITVFATAKLFVPIIAIVGVVLTECAVRLKRERF